MTGTPRQLLADLLDAHLPSDVQLIPYAEQIDAPNTSTVMLRLDRVEPGRAGGLTQYHFALILIAGTISVGAGDDELEALLEDVLFVLNIPDVAAAVGWEPPATRQVYGDSLPSNPAFQVNVTVNFQKG